MIHKFQPSISCYTGSITKILNYYKIDQSEENLFYSKKLLELKCSSVYDGIYTNLECLTNAYLNDCGIVVRDIKLQHLSELDKLIKKYGRLLLKIDCKNLTYAKVFKNAITGQRKHYIVVTNITDKYIEIIDSYIHSTPTTIYEGKLMLTKEKLMEMEFKYLDISKINKDVTINKVFLLDQIIQGYFISVDEAYGQFISNLKGIGVSNADKEDGKILLYEMATALSVSGTIISRRMLCKLLKEIKLVPDTLILELSRIEYKYNALRLLLLKSYVNLSQENLESIIKKVQELKAFESDKYNKVYKILNKLN